MLWITVCFWFHVCSFIQESPRQSPVASRKAREIANDQGKDGLAYNCLLKNELLSAGIEDLKVYMLHIMICSNGFVDFLLTYLYGA